jgi:hypothetical protein
VVREELWKRYFDSGGIVAADNPNAKRMAFVRAAEALIAADLIEKWDPWVWIKQLAGAGTRMRNYVAVSPRRSAELTQSRCPRATMRIVDVLSRTNRCPWGTCGIVAAMAAINSLMRGGYFIVLIAAVSSCWAQNTDARGQRQITPLLSFGPIMREIAEGDGSANDRMDNGTLISTQKSEARNAEYSIIFAVDNIGVFSSPPNGPKIAPGSGPVPSLSSSNVLMSTRQCNPNPAPRRCLMLCANLSPSRSPVKENTCNINPSWGMPKKRLVSLSSSNLSAEYRSTLLTSVCSDWSRISVIWPPNQPINIPKIEITPKVTPNIFLVFNLSDEIKAINIDPDAERAAINGPTDLSVSGDISTIWYVDDDMKAAAEILAVVVILGLIWRRRW